MPCKNATAFSVAVKWLLEHAKGCGSTLCNKLTNPLGCCQPQNAAVPAWALMRWSVKPTAIDFVPILSLSSLVTDW